MLNRLISNDQPRSRLLAAVLILILLGLAFAPFLFPGVKALSVAAKVLIFVVLVVGFDLLLGYTGIVSFAHTMFFGIGAYGIAISSSTWGPTWGAIGLGFALSLGITLAFSLAIGLFSLRVRAIFFAMITLAFAQLVYYVGSGLEAYGGDDGLNISRSRFPGLIDLRDKASFYWLCFALLCASLWFCGRYANSRFGLVIRGAKSNELRMTALGFPVFRYRLAAFTIAGALGGLSGILLANEGAYVSPAMMSWMKSGDLIVIVVLGGMGTLFGPLYGTIAFFVLEEALPPILNLAHKGWGEYWMIVFGPLLVLIALYARGGIDSLLGRRHD